MGIGSIVLAGLKRVPWGSLAMNYGPELLKKVKEQMCAAPGEQELERFADEVNVRIRELEEAVRQRESRIREQDEQLALLAETNQALQGRVRTFQVISGVFAAVSLVLTLLLVT
ncbi:hypothetical protein [Geobacter sp. DSM 9736]|uniref:hypothetical protein n=1 Tax=Geobacter sp. DSM 9736 TaxID=1277350 RepID=UPI000B51135F|nr:hypothetical protein [Geobacter sp. DSM 9736]SNB45664.1 hypothetical protein SAMN06269301_1089 [Geobacter sp. DSM 9736]